MIFVVMKRLCIYSLLIFFCISCEFFTHEVVPEKEIVAQKKQSINLNSVDEFPSFSSCTTLEKEAQKKCFFQTLTDQIYERLAQNNLIVTKTIHDTIQVELHIDTLGLIKVSDIKKMERTTKYIPTLDSLITESVTNLPNALPAHKRGMPVATKFILPIILHVEEQ